MRKRLRFALVSGFGFVLACAALLVADSPAHPIASWSYCPTTTGRCGGEKHEVEVAMNSSFKPTKLPKNKLAPIHLRIEGTIGMSDGSNPPPLQELVLEIDKNGALDAQGLPACGLKRIKGATTSQALKACRPTLVGEGTMESVVAYPEQSPLPPKSKLLAFNGGVKDGLRTIYIHAYLRSPVSAPIVITAKVSKIHAGRYGTKLIATVPPIAEGSGYVKKFQLDFFRLFTSGGKKQSFAEARCFDGKLQARATFSFSDGPPLAGVFQRLCAPRG
jgi:hypothetical protein